jgi:cardiolipin synthase
MSNALPSPFGPIDPAELLRDATGRGVKVAVVDSYWATVGSSNIDPFSLLLAREANIVVENHAFASDLRQRLQQAVAHGAVRLDVANWQRRAWPHRVLSWLAYGGVRIMLGLAGFRRWV